MAPPTWSSPTCPAAAIPAILNRRSSARNSRISFNLDITQDEYIATYGGNDSVHARVTEPNVDLVIDLGPTGNNRVMTIAAANVTLDIRGGDDNDNVSLRLQGADSSVVTVSLGKGEVRSEPMPGTPMEGHITRRISATATTKPPRTSGTPMG